MSRSVGFRVLARHAAALAGFSMLAVVLTWPLVLHLNTHVLGDLTGDTGVYLWNLWIFRHELVRHGHLPFSTEHIFSFTGGADFALHNYTPVAGLLAAPLINLLGLVGTFNLLMMASIATSAYGTYLLARYVGIGRASALAAAVIFAAAPTLTARQTAHFSLVIAAPLPLFVLALLRTLDTLAVRHALAVGALSALATYCDAYYGVYCVLMGIVIVAVRFGRIERRESTGWRRLETPIDILVIALVVVSLWRVFSGVTTVSVGPVRIGLQTLYTPMLAMVLLLGVRTIIEWKPVIDRERLEPRFRSLTRLGGLAVAVSLALLTPTLIGLALRFSNNQLPATPILWRSSPRGVDLLAYLVPNPNHPLFGDITRGWLLPDNPDAFPEFIGSFSLIALVAIAAAAWRRALPRQWIAFSVFFVLLSLGPFVYVAGVNTNIPAPWAFLRYVPVIGMARSPSRFAIVAALGLSMLFAFAIEEWLRVRRGSVVVRRCELAAVTAALVFELVAVPRPLYSAAVPDVYRMIATSDEESGRLLELPTGVRDGTSSIGDFNASSQYYQTVHRRPLIGGYLSRVSHWRRHESLRAPMLRALFTLGEGHDVPPEWKQEALASRQEFLERSCVRYVLVNKHRATPELRRFAVEALRLTPVHEDDNYELFSPAAPPPCRPRHF